MEEPQEPVDPKEPIEPKEPVEPKEFSVPDEYKDRGWASKVKSQDDVWKQIDNLDTLNGKLAAKATTFDYDNATPEEIEKHFDSMRPKTSKDYTFERGESEDEEKMEMVKEVFHKSGVTDFQAKKLAEGLREFRAKELAKAFNAEDYEKTMEEAYGKDYKKTVGQAANLMKTVLPQEDVEFFDKYFPNAQAEWVIKYSEAIRKHYGVVDGDKGLGGEGIVKGEDLDKQRKEVFKQITSLSGKPHTEAEKKTLLEKLKAIDAKRHARN